MTTAVLPLPVLLDELDALARAHHQSPVRLVAVSKTQTVDAVAALAAQGQRVFGENYVQEGVGKIQALQALSLEWHLIGHLQSNKADLVARHFDWVQSVDRLKLVSTLARARPLERGPLNVLIQVNIDDEGSKHGCTPEEIPSLAAAISAEPLLRLRGLMAIPAPQDTTAPPRTAFSRMAVLYQTLQEQYPYLDTLSMGMSGDYRQAVSHGATMVRIGSALFGARQRPSTTFHQEPNT